MARILWLCPLVEYPRAGFWEPKITSLHATLGDFSARWTSTDAIRSAKWACGVADVTDTQLTAIQADTQIHIIEAVVERFARFNTLTAARRTRINAFLTAIGLDTANTTEVLEDLLDRVILSNEPLKNVAALLAELDAG